MSDYYVLGLDGRTPVACDLHTWARGFENDKQRHVARDYVGRAMISTVFLGLDHSFGSGPPQLFETMIFDDDDGDDCWRCATWAEAESQHRMAVALVRAKTTPLQMAWGWSCRQARTARYIARAVWAKARLWLAWLRA